MFVDGGFWHGHPSRFPRPGLSDYWLRKIERNVERDRQADAELREAGWRVVRLWDFDVKGGRLPQAVATVVGALS